MSTDPTSPESLERLIPGELRTRAFERLVAVAEALPESPARGIFQTLVVATRARLFGSADLMALELGPRMAALELISANQPATPELAAAVRSVLWQTSKFATLSDRHLAMWAILSLDEMAAREAVDAGRLDETNSADRIRIFGRLLAAQVPRTLAGVLALCDSLVHEVEVDAVLATYLTRVRVEDNEALFERIRSPGARLEAVVGQVLLGWCPESWTRALALADVALARVVEHKEVNLARKALLVHVSGGDASSIWKAALAESERETQPAMLARAHRAMLIAATCDFGRWLEVVQSIGASRVYLRDPESWLSVRCEVVRSVTTAAKTATDVDRAHQELKELGQRLPNRWFELFHYAVMARESKRVGRSSEVVLAQFAQWMRDGLPRPVVPVSTEEVVAPLIAVDPELAWSLGEALAKWPPQHATWLSAIAVG